MSLMVAIYIPKLALLTRGHLELLAWCTDFAKAFNDDWCDECATTHAVLCCFDDLFQPLIHTQSCSATRWNPTIAPWRNAVWWRISVITVPKLYICVLRHLHASLSIITNKNDRCGPTNISQRVFWHYLREWQNKRYSRVVSKRFAQSRPYDLFANENELPKCINHVRPPVLSIYIKEQWTHLTVLLSASGLEPTNESRWIPLPLCFCYWALLPPYGITNQQIIYITQKYAHKTPLNLLTSHPK